jgi:hypothetical protein
MRACVTIGLLVLALCATGCRRQGDAVLADGGAVVRDETAAARGDEPAARPLAHDEERMSAPVGPVDHLPPGLKPEDAVANAPVPGSAPDVVARTELSGEIPVYPGLTPFDTPTAVRDSETTERVSQVFETTDAFDVVVAWYASHLGEQWQRKSLPTLGRRMKLAQFQRGSAQVQIAEVEGRVRVTVNESRPLA